jgi:hypothetical protein
LIFKAGDFVFEQLNLLCLLLNTMFWFSMNANSWSTSGDLSFSGIDGGFKGPFMHYAYSIVLRDCPEPFELLP